MELAALTVLNQQYTVKRMLGEPGPFDITYLGQHVDSDDEFIIREYFPVHLVRREEGKTSVEMRGEEEADLFDSGMEYFAKESKVLSELSHEALPASYDLFQANGTTYRVRPHPSSMSLAKGLENQGQLSEKAALTIMMPVLEALHTAHEAGLYHGAVSPRTIRLLEGGNVLLTGFSGAYFQLARETGKMSVLVQSGTSPVEQYTPRGQQGPWTDVYSAAATICKMVTDEELPESTDRLEGTDTLEELIQDANVFSAPGVRETLVDALAVDPSQRLQSIEALINALTEASTKYEEGEADDSAYTIMPVESDDEEEELEDDEVEVLSASADRPERASRETDDETASTSQMALLVSIPILLLALGGGGVWYVMSSGGDSGGQSSAYESMRARADSLFQNEEYERAEFFYNQALEFNRDDEYVQQRLARLAELQDRGSEERYQRQLQRGDSLQNVADSLLAAEALSRASNQYSKALGLYYSAQNIKPEEGEVEQRISSIQGRQEQIAKRQAKQASATASRQQEGGDNESGEVSIDQLAKFFRERGDRQLEAGNLKAALDKYKRSLEYKPNNQSLRDKVASLEEQIEEEQGKQKFRRNYNKGRQFLREGKFAEAKQAFQKAEEVMPNEPRLQEAMKTTERMLKQRKEETRQYEQYRARGDSFFEEGQFEEAISSYKNALSIRSDDDYVKRRIEQANQELEQTDLARQEMQKQASGQQADVYETVDQEPKVKGGMASLSREARYPDGAKGQEGRVYVRAVINPDGSVRSAEIERGKNEALNQEALRVVKEAEFEPATYEGNPVPAEKIAWVQFRRN